MKKIKHIIKAERPKYFSEEQFTIYAIMEKIQRYESEHGEIQTEKQRGWNKEEFAEEAKAEGFHNP